MECSGFLRKIPFLSCFLKFLPPVLTLALLRREEEAANIQWDILIAKGIAGGEVWGHLGLLC